ncbi:phage major capsid protein [Streptomyces griseoluteus]|uniref:phage major capsid protein n=1 Tax=Streptomyces griseoluteus TaxID=29306 RepID=UPI0033253583
MDATTLSANFDARERATSELRGLAEQFAGKEMDADARAKEDNLLTAIADYDGRIKRGIEHMKATDAVTSLLATVAKGGAINDGLSGLRDADVTDDDAAKLRALNPNESIEFAPEKRAGGGLKADNPNVLGRTLYGQLIAQAVERSSIMRGGASTFTTSDANPIDFTVITGRSTAGIVGEASPIPESYPTTIQRTITGFKYGHAATVSYEFATDQVLDLVGFLVGDAGPAIGDAMGRHFLTGTGSGQPRGILTDASPATATYTNTADDGTVSDALIDLFYEVPSSYRANAKYVVNDLRAAQMRKLKDANGQYLWQSALTAGAPDTFNGKPVLTDDGMPLDKVLFADLSKYRVRFAGPLRVDRSVDIKFNTDQIVFRFLQRADGLLVDTRGAKVLTVGEGA